jgi:hypothetical protein
LVEHCTENAGVGGSIPPLGTITNASDNIVSAEFAGLIDARRIQAATIAKDFGIKPTE